MKKKPVIIALEDERTPPWLISAFIVLFGVTLVAAMPALAAAAKAHPTAASNHRAAPERIAVRAKVTIFRALQAKAPGGPDLFSQVSLPPRPIAFAAERISVRLIDRGATIAQRGIRSRAPPTFFA